MHYAVESLNEKSMYKCELLVFYYIKYELLVIIIVENEQLVFIIVENEHLIFVLYLRCFSSDLHEIW